ncbi:MAG: cache domain-containing protein [Syntrophales bacterium]|nr:cache domain-containing protein [Syntrophales bacterium]
MHNFHPLSNLRIRYKLLVSYSLVFFLAISLGYFSIYYMVRKTVENNIENELNNSTASILNTVRSSVTVSIKNHLRAMALKNREIAYHFYRQYKMGKMTQAEAKAQATAVLLSQTIEGMTYLYCLDSKGVVVVHPKKDLLQKNVSDFDFVREQKSRKEGYLEYDWKNPDEVKPKPKALYMTYFAPWDWIITATSYREEFNRLINVNDFRDSILSPRFGKTGYSFIIDSKGNLIIHPKIDDKNIYNERDANGRHFIKEICQRKNGKIIYPWKNPDESTPRTKLVIFNYIPELDWIVASSSYHDEFYAPLITVRNIIFVTVVISLLLFIPVTLRISSSITSPIQNLMDRFATGATGDFSVRMNNQSKDELGQLASYFNTFMEWLERYSKNLQDEINEHKQTQEALRRSDEIFSKAFQSSPNYLCITSLATKRIISINETFLRLTGYKTEEVLGKTPVELKLFTRREDGLMLGDLLEKEEHLRRKEIELRTKSGEARICLLSGEWIELGGERCILSTIEDITEWRRLEKEVMNIADGVRQKIGQDLHDDLCAHLIGIEVLSKVLSNKEKEMALGDTTYTEKIRSLISDAVEKTRGLARGLCPVHMIANGLESALLELSANTEKLFGVTCIFECDHPVLIHDNALATHLFYIAQEATQNAIKHGKAKQIKIDLSSDSGKINLQIKDDGSGIPDIIPNTGMGLRIMSYRAKMIHAELNIERCSEGGTMISCSFRISSEKDENRYEYRWPLIKPEA